VLLASRLQSFVSADSYARAQRVTGGLANALQGFTSSPANPAPGEPVTFSWSMSGLDGRSVECALDVDGDRSVDYTIPDCANTTTQTHTFPVEAEYSAQLSVTLDGDVAESSTDVNVVDPRAVIIAAAGDIACDPNAENFNDGEGSANNCHMKATSDVVMSMSPDAVLALGDVQYEEGTLSQFLGSYDLSWGRFKDITYPAVGNHEYLTTKAAGYYDYYGGAAGDPAKGYYSFDLGGWHLVSLNTNCSKVGGCGPGSPQLQWLQTDLATHRTKCTLAFWHHPTFSSGKIGSIDWSREFWETLQAAGAELVLTGHDHHYERFAPQDADGNADPNGLREFVVGTGGRNHTSAVAPQPNSEIRDSQTYGVLKLTLRASSYDWAFVPEAGEKFTDRGTATCR
jgi:hypothetical protein